MNATIYIRKDNQADWDAIEDKSAFVNEAIQNNLSSSLREMSGTTIVQTKLLYEPHPEGNREARRTKMAEPKKDYSALLKRKQ